MEPLAGPHPLGQKKSGLMQPQAGTEIGGGGEDAGEWGGLEGNSQGKWVKNSQAWKEGREQGSTAI